MHVLFAQVSTPEAVKPALSLLDQTVLGAVLIVVLAVAITAVVMLIRVQNARVADQKALNDKSEALMNKMITAFTDMKSTMEALKSSLENLKGAEQETQSTLRAQKEAFQLSLLMRGQDPARGQDPPDPPKKGRG